jgi:DNA-binding transcriptional LysR family regulator
VPTGLGDERPENHPAQGGEHVQALEQLTAPQLGYPVVKPDPEPVLDPLRVRLRPGRRGPAQCRVQRAVALPQNQSVLGPLVQVAVGDELQVDVHRRRPVQRDQQPRLPDVLATISESLDDEQLAALTTGRIDAGFLRAAAAPPGLQLETLLTEPLVAGLPADHRLARHSHIALSELAGEPFVFFPRRRSVLAYDEFIASCRAAGFSPAIVQEASGVSALALVAAGLGVTVVAGSYQALSLDGVRLVPVIGLQLTLQLAWAAGNTNTALPGFLETARQIAGQSLPARLLPGAVLVKDRPEDGGFATEPGSIDPCRAPAPQRNAELSSV